MPNELLNTLLQKATSMSSAPGDGLMTAIENPANWKQGAMPAPPGAALTSTLGGGGIGAILRNLLGIGGEVAAPAVSAVKAAAPVAETLGEKLPEFTPVGGEFMYNLGKSKLPTASEGVYERMMQAMSGK